MKSWLFSGLAVLALGCSSESAPPAAPAADTAAPVAGAEVRGGDAAAPASGREGDELICYMTVVDLKGKPLERMAPIITRTPNAFDEPLAIGGPTNGAGRGHVRGKVSGNVYVRAFDPELNYFPNNFYEVLEGDETVAADMQIVMVPSARLTARLVTPGGGPLGNAPVGLMMFHPDRGPWWPTESTSGANGELHFDNVPAGAYSFRLKAESGEMGDVATTVVPPAGLVHLGDVVMR